MSSSSQEAIGEQENFEECRESALEGYSKVDWSSYGRAGVLSGSEVDLIKSGEETPLEYTLKDEVMAPRYAQALSKVVSSVNDKAALRYVLTRMEDVLVAEECGLSLKERVELFFSTKTLAEVNTDPVSKMRDVFMHCLSTVNDAYCSKTCAAILATILIAQSNSQSKELLEPFIIWLCDQMSASRSAKKSEIKAAVPALTILLRCTAARSIFADHGGVGYVTKLLRRTSTSVAVSTSQQSSQMVYELIFCLWTLSLEWSNSSRIVQDFHAHATIETLVDQVASAPREKVMRVSLATLRNLCSSSGTILSNSQGVAAKMIKAGLVKNLRTLRERPWTDPDVKEDVEHLSKVLSANYRELSTFERYLAEVDSGELDWGSLCHSEAFWKDNAKFAEANDFALIKKLVNIVSEENQGENDAEANKNIAIACSDLGDFVRFYPNGKAVIKHLGAKDSIMKLIDHPDPDVQRHALQCVSKLLVTNWQFVKS